MNNMKINIPQGFEIDKENSSLETGDIVFKKVESKYPSEFEYYIKRDGSLSSLAVSEKYADKLGTLDTLLCLRDEYNKIDGFTVGFNIGRKYWCIDNFENKINLSSWTAYNKIMHFRKEETAKLFLNNFEEQLELIKEFL